MWIIITDFVCSIVSTISNFIFGRTLLSIQDNRYMILDHIAEGGFGTVYKAKNVNTGSIYAIKKICVQCEEQNMLVANEIEAFHKFKHSHILKLIESSIQIDSNNQKVAHLIFPFACGNLRNFLDSRLQNHVEPPNLFETLANFISICEAVCVLHSFIPAYVHQDIKPDVMLNISFFSFFNLCLHSFICISF